MIIKYNWGTVAMALVLIYMLIVIWIILGYLMWKSPFYGSVIFFFVGILPLGAVTFGVIASFIEEWRMK